MKNITKNMFWGFAAVFVLGLCSCKTSLKFTPSDLVFEEMEDADDLVMIILDL